ncbi:hypothetical protein [Lyngbya sp. PCC 8106]|uniref:hypothetical protein n=1 Tax=Lyngbya sp. (strain PCC 8106) TaxID=313612 RepID=UPI0012EA0D11|nr:hypothetical protein [Lyngbya sp. PCC 8106]
MRLFVLMISVFVFWEVGVRLVVAEPLVFYSVLNDTQNKLMSNQNADYSQI